MRRQDNDSMETAKDLLLLIFLVVAICLIASIGNAQTKAEVEKTIREMAVDHGIDPDLAVAIAEVESGLNPNAVGQLGELGVFQLRPEFHDVRRGDKRHNVKVAMRYMNQLMKDCAHYGSAWFVCWNLGPHYKRLKYPTKFPYFVKVQQRMRMIAGGD